MNVIPKTAEQVAEKAGKKVVSVTKHAISTTVDTATHPTAVIKRVQHTNNSDQETAEKKMGTQDVHKHHNQDTKHTTATTTMPLPATRNKLNVDRTKHNTAATNTQRQNQPPQSSEDTFFSISNQSTTFLITIYTAILSIYHAYSHKSELLQNSFPLSVVIPLVVIAFLMGYMLDKLLILFSNDQEEIERRERESSGRRTVRRANGKRRFSNLSIQARRGGLIHGGNGAKQGGVYQPTDSDMTNETNNIDESTQTDTDSTEESVHFSRTREFFKPGWKRKKIKKKYEKYVKEFNHYGGSERSERSSGSKREMTAQFFTNLNPMKRGDVKEWEVKLKAPFRESPLMGEWPCFY